MAWAWRVPLVVGWLVARRSGVLSSGPGSSLSLSSSCIIALAPHPGQVASRPHRPRNSTSLRSEAVWSRGGWRSVGGRAAAARIVAPQEAQRDPEASCRAGMRRASPAAAGAGCGLRDWQGRTGADPPAASSRRGRLGWAGRVGQGPRGRSGRVAPDLGACVLGERPRVASLAAQVVEDGGDDVGIENEGHDSHLGTAAQAAERVHLAMSLVG